MSEILRSQILKRVNITDEEYQRCITFFTPKKIRKKQFLLQEGDVCKYIAFVLKGCLRCYAVDKKGDEHVIQFAIEDWWISDLSSYISGQPSLNNIDALEDSELLLIDTTSREELLNEVPKLERFFRLLLERGYVAASQRLACTIAVSAEERYLSFMKAFPALVQRVPQRHIASYLGITPEALSRIRKHLSEKK